MDTGKSLDDGARCKRNFRLYAAFSLIVLILASGVALPYAGLLGLAFPSEPPCTLAEQIIASNTDQAVGSCRAGRGRDRINVFEDVYLTESLPPITSSIFIFGGAERIVARGPFRIFEVDGGRLTLYSSKLYGGEADAGGAIKVSNGGRLELKYSQIHNSSAVDGGAIASYDSEVLLVASRLSGNRASQRGGALFAIGSTVTLKASELRASEAERGGGIHLVDSTLDAVRSGIANNLARRRGGGLLGERSSLTLRDVVVTGNRSGYGGAGIDLNPGDLTLTHVTLTNNAPWHEGAGLHQTKGKLKIRNSLIASNGGQDCFSLGQLEENISNLVQDGNCDPRISGDPLFREVNGKPTFLGLQFESPAVDAADPDFCTDVDAKAFTKPIGPECDIGAFEYWSPAHASTSASRQDQ